MPDATVEQMIEDGLTRYGRGDLDGALAVWERVLALDPANEQATSYVDYVRQNYDLLTGDAGDESDSPFAIADDEYTVEIIEDRAGDTQSSMPPYVDPLDEGWAIEDWNETSAGARHHDTAIVPEAERQPTLAEGGLGRPLDDGAHDFETSTPVGFAVQPTKLRTRDLGFVRPAGAVGEAAGEATVETPVVPQPLTGPLAAPLQVEPLPLPLPPSPPPPSAPPLTPPAPPPEMGTLLPVANPRPPASPTPVGPPPVVNIPLATDPTRRIPTVTQAEPRPRRGSAPPELKMSLRTPPSTTSELPPATITPAAVTPAAVTISQASSAPGEESTQFTQFGPPPSPSAPSAASPNAPSAASPSAPSAASPSAPSAASPNAALPPVRDARAIADTIEPELGGEPRLSNPDQSPASVALTSAPTTEIPTHLRVDFEERRTRDLDMMAGDRIAALSAAGLTASSSSSSFGIDPKAPTRDLAMRPPAPPTDKLRVVDAANEPTRSEPPPVFGEMDARALEINDEVDEGAPQTEPKDDRTRRRITSLLDHAGDWHRAGDLTKAVAAVDLALSEDPNSALAQKLIHRNRDAIMTVFQGYLGDLERAPALARPLHELASAPINPRAAFLLSRIDGSLTVDEILDVSGMPRLEAYRHLCQLLLRGIIK